MTENESLDLAPMNIHYSRHIDIGATIDIFARNHPRRLLCSTAYLMKCNITVVLYYTFFTLLRSISSGGEIYNPLLEMLVTFGAEIREIIGNLSSESRRRHF